MAISLITGIMGSGKSHQAIKYIVVPNYIKSRKILTNIKGINEDELKKYCLAKYPKIKEEDLGKIVIITDKEIKQEDFYPFLTEEDNKEIINDEKSFVKSGDVVVIDEAFQFYGGKFAQHTMEFFTMHRHFTDENNLSCELCFLVQDCSLLNRNLVKLSKNIYVCKKIDFLGFSKSYTLKIYDGGKIHKSTLINTKTESYDKNIFPIYSSYAKGKGKEENLDKRTTIWNNWRTWVVIGFIVAMPFAIWKVFSVLRHGTTVQTSTEQTQSNNKAQSNQVQDKEKSQLQQTYSNFRIAGVMDLGAKRLVMLEDENHTLKLVQPTLCIGKGLLMTCTIDNVQVSYYNKINSNNIGAKNNENKNTTDNKTSNQNNNNSSNSK